MPVVKCTQSDDLLRSAVVLDLGDLRREGERIIGAARAEADQILALARSEAERLRREASDKGYAQGLARGMSDGRSKGEEAGRAQAFAEHQEQLDALLTRWNAGIERWEAERGRWMLEAREDVLRFACRFASRIVHRQIDLDPSIVVDQVAAALSLLTQPSRARVTVNPADVALIDAALPGLRQRLADAPEIEVAADDSISRGGCRVSAGRGVVDATIETQIDRLVDALLPRREPGPGGSDDATPRPETAP